MAPGQPPRPRQATHPLFLLPHLLAPPATALLPVCVMRTTPVLCPPLLASPKWRPLPSLAPRQSPTSQHAGCGEYPRK